MGGSPQGLLQRRVWGLGGRLEGVDCFVQSGSVCCQNVLGQGVEVVALKHFPTLYEDSLPFLVEIEVGSQTVVAVSVVPYAYFGAHS